MYTILQSGFVSILVLEATCDEARATGRGLIVGRTCVFAPYVPTARQDETALTQYMYDVRDDEAILYV